MTQMKKLGIYTLVVAFLSLCIAGGIAFSRKVETTSTEYQKRDLDAFSEAVRVGYSEKLADLKEETAAYEKKISMFCWIGGGLLILGFGLVICGGNAKTTSDEKNHD